MSGEAPQLRLEMPFFQGGAGWPDRAMPANQAMPTRR